MASETRSLRKRRWKSSPQKSARVGLDFGQKTPSPKKRRIDATAHGPKATSDSFTIKSFYGKKEKIHFPHSPGRRKAVDRVLEKMSDENTDSDTDLKIAKARRKSYLDSVSSSKTNFEFHSSDSAESENDINRRNVLRPKNTRNTKTPLNIHTKSRTKNAVKSQSASKIQSKPALEDVDPCKTPVLSGRKFFKSRTPASADRVFGSIILKKGFDLKFVARKLSVSGSKNKKKVGEKKQVNSTATKSVKKVSAKTVKSIDPDGIFYIAQKENDNTNTGCENSHLKQTVNQRTDLINSTGGNEVQLLNTKIATVLERDNGDSAIDTANSTDMFTSPSDKPESIKTAGSEDFETCEDSAEIDGVAGSEDLFSESSNLYGSTSVSMTTPSASESPSSRASFSDTSSLVSGPDHTPQQKLFPIFTGGRTKELTPASSTSSQLKKLRSQSTPKNSPLLRYRRSKDNMEQMGIDAGQKRFGVSQCDVCGMVYELANPADEMMHQKLHQSFVNTLKFHGWKKERVVQEYRATGCRILMVSAEDPKYATKKVEDINRIMGEELGFPEPSLAFRASYQAFLFVSDEKKIEGCCVCEPISQAYPVLSDAKDSQSSQSEDPRQRPWYCSDVPIPASVGVSRIWVCSQARRKGIATKLLDAVRQWSVYGSVIPKHKLAFSDPTPDGKILATKYTGTRNFLVYIFT